MSEYYGKLISQLGDVENARNIDVNDDDKIDVRDIFVAGKNFGQIWT